MGSHTSTKRLSATFVVLLAVLVLMSVACSFAVMQASSPAAALSTASESAGFTQSTESSAEPGAERDQASHPCGVPQSSPSVASSPLLDPLTVLPLLALFEPAETIPSAWPTHEDLPLRHGDGLLTLLCVQRV